MKRMESLKRAVAIVLALPLSLGLVACRGGLRGGIPISGPPTCTSNCPEFLYATSPSAIVGFKIDPSTGALGSPLTMSGPTQSLGMTATISGDRLYVSDFLNDTVEGFSINSSTGGLAAVGSFPLGGTPPGAGGVSSFVTGGFNLYVTDLNAGAVAAFTYDSLTGTLNTVAGSPFPAGDTPVQAVVAGSQNQFLYVSNLNDSAGGISAFTIAFNTGALTPMPGSPYATGAAGSFPGPSALAIGGSGQNILYVGLVGTTNANNKIAAFIIDANTGALTAIPGSPFATGNAPQYMALVPITLVGPTEFLYTANVQDKTISAFIVDGNSGTLTPLSGSPYHGATSLGGLAVTPTSTTTGNFFLYAADPQAKTVIAFTINGTTGDLSPVPGSPFPAGKAPTLLTATPAIAN